ncbi:unnamed protein product, partial [Ectocarpus sp. 12 AP-2014]
MVIVTRSCVAAAQNATPYVPLFLPHRKVPAISIHVRNPNSVNRSRKGGVEIKRVTMSTIIQVSPTDPHPVTNHCTRVIGEISAAGTPQAENSPETSHATRTRK